MEAHDMSDLPMLLFPYHLGPSTRPFATSLLYADRIAVSMPAWPSSRPIDAFQRVGDRAHQVKHELIDVFCVVAGAFKDAQEHCIAEQPIRDALRDRAVTAMTIYPGTEKHYTEWEQFHGQCLGIAADSLQIPGIIEAAATDFVFRIYELSLEFDDDPDRALDTLLRRARRLGSPMLLLAECALNRYTMPRQDIRAIATDSAHVVSLLGAIGSMGEDFDDEQARAESLSFLFFDSLLAPYAPALHGAEAERLAALMDARATELSSLRKKCASEGKALVTSKPSEMALPSAIKSALDKMRDEVQAILSIDRATLGKLVHRVTEDRVIWTSLAGLVGSAVANLPPEVMGSAALTLFSALGTTAVKAGRERREALKASPWAFLYYLQRS